MTVLAGSTLEARLTIVEREGPFFFWELGCARISVKLRHQNSRTCF